MENFKNNFLQTGNYVKRKDNKQILDNKGFDETENINKSLYDEDDIPEVPPASRPVKIIKRVFKIVFISLMAAVWIVILAIIILRSNHEILETPILSDGAREIYSSDKAGFVMYRVYSQDFMTTDGSLQLANGVYAESAHEFEIGVRIAWTQLRYCKECDAIYTPAQLEDQQKIDKQNKKDNPDYQPAACTAIHHLERASVTGGSISYTLTDSLGNSYPPVNRVSRTKELDFLIMSLKYEYERVAFSGLYFDIENNIINRVDMSKPESSGTESGESSEDGDEANAGVVYYLNIYDEKSGHFLFSSYIYDNNTYIARKTYKYPDRDYLD